MKDIRRVLFRAAWRLWITGVFRALVVFVSVGLAAALLLRVAQQLFVLELPWWDIALWSGVGASACALIWSIVFRARRDAVARRVDEGAQLKEALSTALVVESQTDPWSRATVASAAERARGVRVRSAVPIESPRLLPVPLALAVAMVIVWIALPPIDITGRLAQVEEEKEQERIIEEVSREAEKTDELKERLNKIDPEAGAEPELPEAENAEANKPRDPVAVQIREVNNLLKRADAVRQGEKGQAMDAMKDMLSRLRPPGEELSELTRALSQGDFSGAAAELEALKQKLESANLSDAQKQALQQQLSNLAEQMKELAANKDALAKKLAESGLDKELSSDPEALRKAIEQAMQNAQNAEGLSDEQRQQRMQQLKQLQEMAESTNKACSMCQGMAGSMGQMAKAMGQEGMEGMEGAMAGMQGQLSELEMMSMELAEAGAISSEAMSQLASLSQLSDSQCEGLGSCDGSQMGTRPWSAGLAQSKGNGSGGPGQGRGGSPGEQKANEKWDSVKWAKNMRPGPSIGTRYVEGEGIKNESREEFAEVVRVADSEASKAIEENIVPREYHDVVKRYFGRLKAKTEVEVGEDSGEEPAEDSSDDTASEGDGSGEG